MASVDGVVGGACLDGRMLYTLAALSVMCLEERVCVVTGTLPVGSGHENQPCSLKTHFSSSWLCLLDSACLALSC